MFQGIWWCFVSSAELSLNHDRVPFRALSVCFSQSLIAFERAHLQLCCQTLAAPTDCLSLSLFRRLSPHWNHTECTYFKRGCPKHFAISAIISRSVRLSVDAGNSRNVNVLSVSSAFTVLAHTAVSVLMTDRVSYVQLKGSYHTVFYHYFPEVHSSRFLIISKKHQGFLLRCLRLSV